MPREAGAVRCIGPMIRSLALLANHRLIAIDVSLGKNHAITDGD